MTAKRAEADEYGVVRAYALHKDARVIDHDELRAEQKRFLSQLDRDSIAYGVFSDPGRYAAAQGCDAIVWSFADFDGKPVERALVLNRGALFMEGKG